MNWYNKVVDDLGTLPDFISYFESELETSKTDVSIRGNLEKNLVMMPGLTEKYYGHLQTIESVLEHLNISLRKIRSQQFKKFLENYQRQLSSRDCEKYVDGVDDVIDMETLINSVAYLRNRYLTVTKSLENKQWMLGNIVRVRTSGLSEVEI